MNLINKTECRKFLLAKALTRWPNGKFTRVSQSTLDYLEDAVRNLMDNIIVSHPTIGKTIMIEDKHEKKAGEEEDI